MARLPILQFPDNRLRLTAAPVLSVDDAVRALVTDMADTMYAAGGIGLAATQVGVLRRIVVVDVSDDRSRLEVLVNPEIVDRGGTAAVGEGCLSIPNAFAKVHRSAWVTVRALDGGGASRELSGGGVLAMVLQHEIDHLDGILFLDHLSDRAARSLGLGEPADGRRGRR